MSILQHWHIVAVITSCHEMFNVKYFIIYLRDIMVTNFANEITYEGMCCEVMDICQFDTGQPFTLKWVDEDGK